MTLIKFKNPLNIFKKRIRHDLRQKRDNRKVHVLISPSFKMMRPLERNIEKSNEINLKLAESK